MHKVFSLTPTTFYAPSDRKSYEEIKLDMERFLEGGIVAPLLDALEMALLVMNGNRQLVFANRAFLSYAGAEDVDAVLGLRFGEIVGCDHANSLGGCGTQEPCRACAVVNSVMAALDGRPASEPAKLNIVRGGREREISFKVATAPLPFPSGPLVIVSLGYLGDTRLGPAE